MKSLGLPAITVLFLAAMGFSSAAFSPTANAALISQMGGQTLYDTDLNIIWLSNANLANTNDFGVAGIEPNGNMNFSTANAWVAAMNTANYLGFSDWRLPVTAKPDSSCTDNAAGTTASSDPLGFNCTGSEMGHLFYNELGGVADIDILTSSDPDLSLFSNISGSYWSSTEDTPGRRFAFGFTPPSAQPGFQGTTGTIDSTPFVLVVRSVPEPSSVLLLGSGLIGLVCIAKRTGSASPSNQPAP